MPTFNSEEEIKKYFLKRSEVAIENAKNKIYSVLEKHLHKYYNEYHPEMYQRTYKLLRSLVKTNVVTTGNTVRASVYFDVGALDYDEKVMAYIDGYDVWLSAKPKAGATMQAAMHDGTHGGHGSGTAIWDESMIELRSIVGIIVDELREAGIPIK